MIRPPYVPPMKKNNIKLLMYGNKPQPSFILLIVLSHLPIGRCQAEIGIDVPCSLLRFLKNTPVLKRVIQVKVSFKGLYYLVINLELK